MFIMSCAQFRALTAVVVALYTGFQSETIAQQVKFVKIWLMNDRFGGNGRMF